MTNIRTITFFDLESRGETVAIVRAHRNSVALCLSARKNGDVEVLLSPDDADQLVKALQQALLTAREK